MAETRCGVFVNYRRDDTGFAAKLVARVLRQRLGSSIEVFIDNRSIQLGQVFSNVLREGVERSAVLVAMIGRQWDQPPFLSRLHESDDWVRREIVLANEQGSTVVPVLVDRDRRPVGKALPEDLQFLARLQQFDLRQAYPDEEVLADRIAGLVPSGCGGTAPLNEGVKPTREAVAAFLRSSLPPAQQASGNRDRLVELVLTLLGDDDRLVYLAPARLAGRPNGSATVLITATDIVVADIDNTFRIRINGTIRFPLSRIARVEVVLTRRIFLETADVVLHTTAGDVVPLLGLFRDQARQLADHLRS